MYIVVCCTTYTSVEVIWHQTEDWIISGLREKQDHACMYVHVSPDSESDLMKESLWLKPK